MPLLGLTTPESQEVRRAVAKRRFRLLSPLTTGDEPAGQIDDDAFPPAKRPKTATSAPPATRPTLPPPLYVILRWYGVASPPSGPQTTQSLRNVP